jgi:hypothetical protein
VSEGGICVPGHQDDAAFIPAARTFLQIGALSTADCMLVVLVGLCPVTVIELEKLVREAMRRD